MAFSIGYVGVCERNIQHLYTTRSLKPPAKRKSIPYKPGFLNDFDAERRKRERNRPFMEYDAQHEIEIPKAPSFRNVPRKDVDEIVKRLTMPPKERFHFKYTDHLRYNDWQTAHFEKIQQLRETISKFGGIKEHVVKTEDQKMTKKVKRKRKSIKKTGEEGSLPAI